MRWRVSERVVEEDMVTVAAAMVERERGAGGSSKSQTMGK